MFGLSHWVTGTLRLGHSKNSGRVGGSLESLILEFKGESACWVTLINIRSVHFSHTHLDIKFIESSFFIFWVKLLYVRIFWVKILHCSNFDIRGYGPESWKNSLLKTVVDTNIHHGFFLEYRMLIETHRNVNKSWCYIYSLCFWIHPPFPGYISVYIAMKNKIRSLQPW